MSVEPGNTLLNKNKAFTLPQCIAKLLWDIWTAFRKRREKKPNHDSITGSYLGFYGCLTSNGDKSQCPLWSCTSGERNSNKNKTQWGKMCFQVGSRAKLEYFFSLLLQKMEILNFNFFCVYFCIFVLRNAKFQSQLKSAAF